MGKRERSYPERKAVSSFAAEAVSAAVDPDVVERISNAMHREGGGISNAAPQARQARGVHAVSPSERSSRMRNRPARRTLKRQKCFALCVLWPLATLLFTNNFGMQRERRRGRLFFSKRLTQVG